MADINVSVSQAVTIAEDKTSSIAAAANVSISAVQACTITDAGQAGTLAFRTYKALNSASIALLTGDWCLTDTYKKFGAGLPLKGIVLIPGSAGPDTFVIKDGGENGPFLYSGIVSGTTTIEYPGSLCKPFIDYSECILSAGHIITFVW